MELSTWYKCLQSQTSCYIFVSFYARNWLCICWLLTSGCTFSSVFKPEYWSSGCVRNFLLTATAMQCIYYIGFLAVQNNAIGDLVTESLTESLSEWFFILTLQSDPRDLWPLRHLIRVMRKHDLTNILAFFFYNFWHVLTI